MTRDQVAAFMLERGIEANVDDVYYLVGMAIKQEREACLNDIELERESWKGNRSGLGVMVCGYIMESIKKRGMA